MATSRGKMKMITMMLEVVTATNTYVFVTRTTTMREKYHAASSGLILDLEKILKEVHKGSK